MAELQTKGMQREETPIYKPDVALKPQRTIDQSVSDPFFMQAKMWDEAGKFTDQIGRIVNTVEQNRQDDVLQKMKENLINTSLKNEGLIGELRKYDSSKLSVTELLEQFNTDEGIKVEGGSIKLQSVEHQQGYEGLSSKNKRVINEIWKEADTSTKRSIFQEATKLSRAHKKSALTKSGLNTSNTIMALLHDKESHTKTTGVAPYIEKLAEFGGRSPFNKSYREYWTEQLMSGNPNIPGSPPGGAKIEDLGSPGGLKPVVKKQIDRLLDTYQDELFDALENSNIEFSDVDELFNTTMQSVLKEQFVSEYSAFPAQAVQRARAGGYSYTREFDNKFTKGQIEYVLDPAYTKKYILAHSAKKPPKTDHLHYDRILQDLKNKMMDPNFRPNPREYVQQQYGWDEKLTPQNIGALELLIGDNNRKNITGDKLADKQLILSSIEQLADSDKTFLDKISTKTKDGILKIKPLSEIKKAIPGRHFTNYEWQWLGKRGSGKMVKKESWIGGKDRAGVEALELSDFANLLIKYNKESQAALANGIIATYDGNLETDLGREDIFDEFAEYGENGKPTHKLNHERLDHIYNKNGDESVMWRTAFPSFTEFHTFAKKLLTAAHKAENAALKGAKAIKGKWIPDSRSNIRALDNAIIADHRYLFQEWVNMANGIQDADGKPTKPEYADQVTPKGGTNLEDLLLNMKKQHGDDATWGPDGKKRLKKYNAMINSLYETAATFKLLSVPDLEKKINELNHHSGTRYYLTQKMAKHISEHLTVRHQILTTQPSLARLMIEKELQSSDFWYKHINIDPQATAVRQLQQISRHLRLDPHNYLNLADPLTNPHAAILKYRNQFVLSVGDEPDDTSLSGKQQALSTNLPLPLTRTH